MRYILILCIYFFTTTAKADDKTIRIAIADFPPFEYYNNDKVEGINIQTIKDVLSRAGYSVEFYSLPWKRALISTESGDMDALASIIKSTTTEPLFIFSKPIMYTQYFFLKNKNLSITPRNYNDIKNYAIGTIDQYFYGENFASESSLQLFPIASPTPDVNNLEKLNHGRLDLVACSIHVCKYWLQKYGKLFDNIDYLTSLTVGNEQTLHLAFSKKNPARSNEIVTKFNEELAKYIEEGNIEKNIAQYSNDNADFSNFDRGKLK